MPMLSPYLKKGTDGKDIGYDKSAQDFYMAATIPGDRRTVTFDRPTGAIYFPDKNGVMKLRALLPRTYLDVDTFTLAGKTVRNATDDASLTAALTAAAGSATPSVIVVALGTYTQVHNPPARSFSDTTMGSPNITIIIGKPIYDSMIANGGVSLVMPAKKQVVAADLAQQPFFKNTSVSNVEQWAFGNNVNGYRVVGLRFGVDSTVSTLSRLMRLGNGDSTIQTNASLCPRNICIDRCSFTGHSTLNIKAALEMHAISQAMIDCYTDDEIHHDGQDCQAIRWYNSPGPTCILNNRLTASTEHVIIGGSFSACGLPSDLEFTGNTLQKPKKWNSSEPTYAGKQWLVKNLFEVKALGFGLIQGNYLDRSWQSAQAGAAFLIKAESYGNGDIIGYTHDVTVRFNKVEDAAFGINMAGTPAADPAHAVTNVCSLGNSYEIGALYYSAAANPFIGLGKSSNCGSLNDTFISMGTVNVIAAPPTDATDTYFINSIFEATTYGLKGGGVGEGIPTLNSMPGSDMRNCVLVNRPSGSYPTSNFFPASASIIAYTDRAAKDYSLSGTTQVAGGPPPPPPPPSPVLSAITVTPATASVEQGLTKQYTATGTDQFGQPFTFTPTWSVVGGAGTIDSNGLFTAGATSGSYPAAIKATSGGISGTASVTVTTPVTPPPPPPPPPPTPVLTTLSVVPSSASLTVGDTKQFVCYGHDQFGQAMPCTPAWSVVAGGGTIDGTGLFTAGAAGFFPATVKATVGALSDTADVTITAVVVTPPPDPVPDPTPPPPPPPPVLTSIRLSAASAVVWSGGTYDFNATGYDQNGLVMTFTPVWSVEAGGGTIDQNGLFTAGPTPGAYAGTVKARSGGLVASADITIPAPPPPPPTVPPPPQTRPTRKGLCGYYTRRRRL